MPFLDIFRRNDHNHIPEMSSKEKKSMLGLKAIQAQQNPAPFYDLSGCDAQSIPDDTYTFCKLLGKTCLLINNNHLTGLDSGGSTKDLIRLEQLDASFNKIEKFSSSIYSLKNLKILNVSQNKLKNLPAGFHQLSSLEELNLSNNKLYNVPPSICALPRLKILQIQQNFVSKIPNELCLLQKSLVEFTCDKENIKYPPNMCSMDLEAILIFLCNIQGTKYTGRTIIENMDDKSPIEKTNYKAEIDWIMADYLQNKEEQVKIKLKAEGEYIKKEQLQIQSVLKSNQLSKEQLLNDLPDGTPNLSEYESRKQEKLEERMNLEKEFTDDQAKQLEQYMSISSNKESLLGTIISEEQLLQKEVAAIIEAKDIERAKLFSDLSSAESDIDATLQEIVNYVREEKSSERTLMVQQQDAEMEKLLIQYEQNTSTLNKEDILQVMKQSMITELENAALYHAMDDKKKAFALSVLGQAGLEEESNLRVLLDLKDIEAKSLLTDLEENERQQEAAFKLLLLKVDLKRNNILRQIASVEYELTRLSSLELRKKNCDLQYGSNSMLNQRTTLANLLGSLIKARDTRENELYEWCLELEDQRTERLELEDYWVHQYQRLMTLKPPSLAKAEEHVDEQISQILSNAYAMDLLPVFARHDISYSRLMQMSEEDFSAIDVGHATYTSIQRSLMKYLNEQKVGTATGSDLPSAPPLDTGASSTSEMRNLPQIYEGASAPPIEQTFQEFECVVCLNKLSCIVFLNCGHVCVCSDCCVPLSNCPLCRAAIISKYYVATK